MKGILQYQKNISSLIEATLQNKIEWKKQNPTTFYFEGSTSTGYPSLVSLQSIFDDFNVKEIIQLKIINRSTRENILSLDSETDELRGLLETLYSEASYSIEKKSIDYFDDLIGNL